MTEPVRHERGPITVDVGDVGDVGDAKRIHISRLRRNKIQFYLGDPMDSDNACNGTFANMNVEEIRATIIALGMALRDIAGNKP
jgi:hypothetical protein